MKLLLENWQKYLDEVMQFSVADYRNPQSQVGLIKSKLSIVYKLQRPLTLKNDIGDKYIVTYESPTWFVESIHEKERFKDVAGVVDHLNKERVNFKTAEMVEE